MGMLDRIKIVDDMITNITEDLSSYYEKKPDESVNDRIIKMSHIQSLYESMQDDLASLTAYATQVDAK